MTEIIQNGVFLENGKLVNEGACPAEEARKNTMAYRILQAHNTSGREDKLKIKFDAMASHDITYVGIIQTARASGLREFPLPYVLTNCHNSLCAVGGTINEDDHVFGLSAAKKYGGIYVPAHQAVIHSFMRETMTGCGRMILGSDSHTRYGALGTMAIGEGGPELVKQLLNRTYDIDLPQVIAVYLTGKPNPGVGPQDVALALIGATFASGFVKNKVLEFVGDGIAALPIEYRNGIDVMTTETTCLSSIWQTDEVTKAYYQNHGREQDFAPLSVEGTAYYDGAVVIDLSKVKPMIALPFHPSNVYTIKELNENAADILREVEKKAAEQLDNKSLRLGLTDKLTKDGKIQVEQGVIAGCAGGIYDNLVAAADILRGKSIGNGAFALSVYPASAPVAMELMRNGTAADLMAAGATMRTAFCGPCFGAGDVPANGGLSIRHSTRNFPNREGSKPASGQIASVALMDARSIAATAANGGVLTAADEIEVTYTNKPYHYDHTVYENRVYRGFGKAQPEAALQFGPNIADWPEMIPLADNLLLKVVAEIHDPVTTTDELIPSGETSSYRSNPMKLAEFTLSRKVPAYVERAKEVYAWEQARRAGQTTDELGAVYAQIQTLGDVNPLEVQIGSVIYANKPGDGSAREQAASCQRVLGGSANIAREYATKRYRSNLINWGMLPFLIEEDLAFGDGDYLYVPGVREAMVKKSGVFKAYVVKADGCVPITLKMDELTDDERDIILAGCLINYYRSNQ
ncbi:MAG: hydratase [Clostridiales bacterium]|nr:hydratase [Clostridiales bacterium]